MTDRQHPPQRAGSHGSPTAHHGRDPQPVGESPEENKPKLPVNVIQISASAGAAVTSAIAASYFGVGGTIAGAAFGSVVSSVAGTFYTNSLKKAHQAVQTTTAVVVQRFPGDVPQADSIHRMSGPAGVPVADSLNRVGHEDTRHVDVERVQVPVGDETELMSPAHDDQTRMMPPVTGPVAGATGHSGPQPHRSQVYGSRSAARKAPAAQIWWKKPGFLMAGLAGAAFLIAMFVITGVETVIDKPISGGDSGGTTLSKLVSNNTSSTTDDSDDSESTPTESVTPSEGTVTETATPEATDPAGTVPTETAAPDVTSTDVPTATDTAPATGSDEVQPTDGTGTGEGDGTTTDQGGTGDGTDTGSGTDTQLQQEQPQP
ncbi:hypothetical protein [Kineosporia succinea]|uniref:Uncharacterized protein n=1 Tax=Kineosporia succinea TaxID=84632 RepID=A0ABT9P318_9ACTN|nr:hypothetical protein [Kineosporia succinea]MDP9826966.1 hypothetical protein [Kineosporia succinea]